MGRSGYPLLCPYGGHLPSQALGTLGFSVGATGTYYYSNYTVVLSHTAPPDCSDDGPFRPGLFFVFQGYPPIEPGIYDVAEVAGGMPAAAALYEPNGEGSNAVGGYIVFSDVNDGGFAAGGFDLRYAGGPTGEVSGSFYAPTCP
jgi:hypothetical protein